MEIEQFDAFTRQMSGAGSSRRQTLRALAGALFGGTLAAAATRLGLTETAEAKPKRRHRKSHAGQPDRDRGQLQAQARRKGKKGKKKPKNPPPPPPLPPECQSCNDCQMCKDGACYRDPALEGVRCLGSGSNCGYCKGGICTPTERQPCEDGVCPRYGECCPEKRQCGTTCVPADQCCEDEFKCIPDGPCVGQYDCCPDDGPKKCPDPFTPRGFYCVDQNVCCVERERKCDDGSCIPLEACCLEQRRCGPKVCVGKNECCPGEKPCAGGKCVAADECCPNQPKCGTNCCAPGEGCVPRYEGGVYAPICCELEKIVGGQCCVGDKTICGPPGNEHCCPAGSRCYQDLNGMWLCCAGELCGQHRCCVGNTQCHSGCGTPDGNACCIGESGCGCCRICAPA